MNKVKVHHLMNLLRGFVVSNTALCSADPAYSSRILFPFFQTEELQNIRNISSYASFQLLSVTRTEYLLDKDIATRAELSGVKTFFEKCFSLTITH